MLPQNASEVEFAAPAPRIAAVEAVVPDGGLVAEREVEGVHARALVEDGQVCVVAAGPEPEVSARSCQPVEALPDQVELVGPAGQRPLAVTATPPAPEGLLLDHRGQAPLLAGDRTDAVTPAVVVAGWQRVFIIDHGDGRLAGVLADAHHLEDEGLWWCPGEQVFVSPFHGELSDAAGQLVHGPARADLTTAPVSMLDGLLLTIDLDQATPGQRRDGDGLALDADIDPRVYERYQRWLNTDGDTGFCSDHQPPIQRPGTTLTPPSSTP